jgi:L-seryl-tRNA(Ser) seleniumtransferase
MSLDRNTALRSLPAVHRLLSFPEAEELFAGYPESMRTEAIGEVLDVLRQTWGAEMTGEASWRNQAQPVQILLRARAILDRKLTPHLRPVLNLTGTVIHTNLGRAPLSARAVDAVRAVAEGYSNLEYDLETGERGSRHVHAEQLLCDLTGAEAALVVNNNAAAVFLVLKVMAAGGEAILSRGQLVEIGGSFRIPDIMRESGVQLVEVGTTNKTRLSDYEFAIAEETKLVVKVHTSNFRMVGFTEQPPLDQLVSLVHQSGIPVYEDLGSGSLFDYVKSGVGDEPTVRNSVACGVDVVSFSGDKLLGGAQAGIIVGNTAWIERMKKHPLTRALRVDKMTLAALEATLLAQRDNELARAEIPVIRMLTESYEAVAARSQEVYERLRAALGARLTGSAGAAFVMELGDDASTVGGGALPGITLPTNVIRISSHRGAGGGVSAQELADLLRTQPDIPVVARIGNDTVILDVRTLLPGQEQSLVEGVASVLASL